MYIVKMHSKIILKLKTKMDEPKKNCHKNDKKKAILWTCDFVAGKKKALPLLALRLFFVTSLLFDS